MNYADIKQYDVANGPGVRISLFVSGCTHHCKGCFNEVAWDFNYGQEYTKETTQTILSYLEPSFIKGITILGGEPFEPSNQKELVYLLRSIREKYPEKDIWCFSGYLFDQDIVGKMCVESEITREMLSYIDILVDGKFVLEKKDLSIRFRGSSNQRIIKVQESMKSGKLVLSEEYM